MTGLTFRGIHLLALAYLMGVAGTLWDWHEHLAGALNEAPHAVIDIGGLLALGVLAFTGWTDFRRSAFTTLYVLLVLVALIAFGPFVLMMTAPHSQLMALFMSWAMTRGALVLELPIVLLAGWAARRWLLLAPIRPWRLAAALGVVVVAIASVWDLYWHQTHPMEMGASTNMMALPPHQAVLGGFVAGLLGSVAGLAGRKRSRGASTIRAS